MASTAYCLYQKYEKREGQDWLPTYPNEFSLDGDGTMPISTLCGEEVCDCATLKVSTDRLVFYPNTLEQTVGAEVTDCNIELVSDVNWLTIEKTIYEFNVEFKITCDILRYSNATSRSTTLKFKIGEGFCATNTIQVEQRVFDEFVTIGTINGYAITSRDGILTASLLDSAAAPIANYEHYNLVLNENCCMIDSKAIKFSSSHPYDSIDISNANIKEVASSGFTSYYYGPEEPVPEWHIVLDFNNKLEKAGTRCFYSIGKALDDLRGIDNLVSVGDEAFRGCGVKFKELTLNKLTDIEAGAFYLFKAEGLNINNIKSLNGGVFSYCSIDNDLNLESLEEINGNRTFSSLKSKNLNMPNLRSIKGNETFDYAETNINAPNLTSISGNYTFSHLKTDTISLPSLQSMDNVYRPFSGSTSITNISLPSLTYISGYNIFSYLTNLTSIELPSLVSTTSSYLFNDCPSLTNVSLPIVEEIGSYSFERCTSLKDIELPKLKKIGDYLFDGCTSLTNVSIPLAEEVGKYAFRNCTSLKDIELPFVKKMGERSFDGCTSLTNVSLPVVEEIRFYSFNNCTSIEHINLSKLKEVTAYLFYGCSGLKSLDLQSVETIVNGSFYNCSSLTSLYLPSLINTSSASSAFYNCKSMTEIHFGDKVTGLYGESNTFSGCTALTDIYIEATTPPELSANYFNGATNLKNIWVPSESVIAYNLHTRWSNYSSKIKGMTF